MSFGMGLSSTFLRISVIDLSYSYLFLHDLHLTVLDVYFVISLYAFSILCMIRQLAFSTPILVPVFECLL